jgi:hypothetical protein
LLFCITKSIPTNYRVSFTTSITIAIRNISIDILLITCIDLRNDPSPVSFLKVR